MWSVLLLRSTMTIHGDFAIDIGRYIDMFSILITILLLNHGFIFKPFVLTAWIWMFLNLLQIKKILSLKIVAGYVLIVLLAYVCLWTYFCFYFWLSTKNVYCMFDFISSLNTRRVYLDCDMYTDLCSSQIL
jgi:hypothetical protein